MLRTALSVLFSLVIFFSTASSVSAQNGPLFDEEGTKLMRSLNSLQLTWATLLLKMIVEGADCTDEALADSLEAAARERVRHIQAQITELSKANPDPVLFRELNKKFLDASERMIKLLKKCDENEKRYQAQIASVPTIKDFGELEIGQTYRVASEYCWKQHDLRETFDLYAMSGRRPARKLWREKTATKLCVEDSPTETTEFRVVKLADTVDLKGDLIYLIEVVIDGKTAFLTSTIPIVAAN